MFESSHAIHIPGNCCVYVGLITSSLFTINIIRFTMGQPCFSTTLSTLLPYALPTFSLLRWEFDLFSFIFFVVLATTKCIGRLTSRMLARFVFYPSTYISPFLSLSLRFFYRGWAGVIRQHLHVFLNNFLLNDSTSTTIMICVSGLVCVLIRPIYREPDLPSSGCPTINYSILPFHSIRSLDHTSYIFHFHSFSLKTGFLYGFSSAV